MDKQEILARIELIITHPTTSEEDKVTLKLGCELLRQAITREQIIKGLGTNGRGD